MPWYKFFWMFSFKPAFSLSSFTLIKRLFSSSLLSAIRVVGWLENRGTDSGAIRNRFCNEKHAHAYCWKKAEAADWNCPGLCQFPVGFLWLPSHTPSWGQGLLQSRGVPLRELGGGTILDLAQHLYEVRVSIDGAHRGRGLAVVQSSDWCWNCQSLHPHPCPTPTVAALAPAMLPFCQCLEGG